MEQILNADIAALQRMSTSDLRRRYAEVFGDQPAVSNRVWMLKRLAWRLQALAEGGLTERARRRAEERANDADLPQCAQGEDRRDLCRADDGQAVAGAGR